jgi:2,4'-dihydroxyacetophenone dioxygenase
MSAPQPVHAADHHELALGVIPVPLRHAVHLAIDDLPFVDVGDGSAIQLLHVDLSQGLWVIRTRFQPGYQVAKHYHTGPVFAVTSAGSWHYLEYPEHVNRAGSYLFEPAGSVHTLAVHPDETGVTEAWFAVFGANVNIGADGGVAAILDAPTILKNYRLLCAAHGKSAERVLVLGE